MLECSFNISISFAVLVASSNEYALVSIACKYPFLLVYIKSLCKSSVFACAIECTIPSIFPFSSFIFSKTDFTCSSSEASSSAYILLPLNSDTSSFTFSLLLSPLYVNISLPPFSYTDCAMPNAILHLFLIPIINIFLPSSNIS